MAKPLEFGRVGGDLADTERPHLTPTLSAPRGGEGESEASAIAIAYDKMCACLGAFAGQR